MVLKCIDVFGCFLDWNYKTKYNHTKVSIYFGKVYLEFYKNSRNKKVFFFLIISNNLITTKQQSNSTVTSLKQKFIDQPASGNGCQQLPVTSSNGVEAHNNNG